jgi:hypothetical protein
VSPSTFSVASPWYLLLAFCCFASFSDCGGGATRAGEGVHRGRQTGRAGGLWRGRERLLSPSVTRAGSTLLPFSFLFYAGF